MKKSIVILLLATAFISCSIDKDDDLGSVTTFKFDFNASGQQEWKSFFSDFPVGEENFYELEFKYTELPEPLDNSIKSLKISGNNHSDDLLSVVYRKFEDLKPNTKYTVTFDIEVASNAPTNALGVGGSPDLAIGAGGINFEPKNTTVDNTYRPNFESRLQSGESNNVFKVLGNIGVSDDVNTPFKLIKRDNLDSPITLNTNDKGELWLMIATDSGFEATTTLYYKSITVNFR